MRATGPTIDPGEIGRFAAQAESWWDPDGSFRALHRINPARLSFIRQHLTAHFHREASSLRPFDGLTLLDIGCGGGLVTEPMARLGFAVTGIDAGAEAIEVARTHAEATGLAIDYCVTAAEPIAEAGRQFETNCDYVGSRFAEEARRIHYGEIDAHSIYGEASEDESRELTDEGISFGRIPWVPSTDS